MGKAILLKVIFPFLTVAEILETKRAVGMRRDHESGTYLPPIPAGKPLETFGTQNLQMVTYLPTKIVFLALTVFEL
jgi:hypothetical protein